MPNELFEELQNYMINSTHIAYAYCYLYLIHFLYRNCKYFNVSTLLDGDTIKQILGYSKSNRTMNYITKSKTGILDENGFTESTKDYPMLWSFKKDSRDDLEFTMYSEMENMKDVLPSAPKKFLLKYPKLAFEKRIVEIVKYVEGEEEIEELELSGTFFDIEQTHTVDFKVFMYCMSKKELGVVAFYLYSFIKHKSDMYGSFDCPLPKLAEITGIKERTLNQYMDFLKGYRMIAFRHNMERFSWTASQEERKANTYYAESFDSFLDKYKDFAKMKSKTLDEYEIDRRKREEEENRKKGIISFSDLPF